MARGISTMNTWSHHKRWVRRWGKHQHLPNLQMGEAAKVRGTREEKEKFCGASDLLCPPELLRHLVGELDAASGLDAPPNSLSKADLEHQVVDLDDEEDGDGGEADVQGEPAGEDNQSNDGDH